MTPWDRSKYPDAWEEIVAKVRQRSGDKCEWCGAANGQPHPKTGGMVTLTTAHIYDKRPTAADLDNLAHLCNRCHLNHDRHNHIHKAGPSGDAIQIPLTASQTEQEAKHDPAICTASVRGALHYHSRECPIRRQGARETGGGEE